MRFPSSRASAFVATSVALLVAFLLASPRDDDSRENHVRTTRAGIQRLDATEAIDHGFEDPHPILTPAADVLQLNAVQTTVHAPPGAAMLPQGAAMAHDHRSTLLLVPPARTVLLARPHRPALGRAPPTA